MTFRAASLKLFKKLMIGLVLDFNSTSSELWINSFEDSETVEKQLELIPKSCKSSVDISSTLLKHNA